MPKKWSEISRVPAKERERIREEVRARRERQRMRLADLRRARHLSQADIAERADMLQGDVSKIERRADMYLRTLRSYVEAAGGTLRLIAEFPNQTEIELEVFSSIDEPTAEERREARSSKDRKSA